MEKFVLVLILVLDVMVRLGTGQHHLRARVEPWRHRIQWENNGQVYSLLSTGSQYRSPAQVRRRTQLLLTTRNSFNLLHPPVALSRSSRTRPGDLEDAAGRHFLQNDVSQMDAAALGADAGQYLLAAGPPGPRSQTGARLATSGEAAGYRSQQAPSNRSFIQEFSGSGVPRGGRSTPGDDAGVQQATASPVRSPDFAHSQGGRTRSESSESPATAGWVTVAAEDRGNARRIQQQTGLGDARSAQRAHPLTRNTAESNVSPTALSSNSVEIHYARAADMSDPRDPHSIHHRNSVYYDVYPADRRNRVTVRPAPGPGYGTRFFHNGETL